MVEQGQRLEGEGRRPRRRTAKGPPRPAYLDSPDLDKLGIMVVALIAEVLAIKDRIDTHEVLLERDGGLTARAIEAFRPDAEQEAAREARRLAALRRIFRVMQEELDALEDAPADGPTGAAR